MVCITQQSPMCLYSVNEVQYFRTPKTVKTFMQDSKTILSELQATRQSLEMEAEAIVSELTSPGPNGEAPAGIRDPLVDKEGFPRADIDLYRVRSRRQRLAIINTDHKRVMTQIENEMYKHYETKMAESDVGESLTRVLSRTSIEPIMLTNSSSSATDLSKDVSGLKPIAVIDEVFPSSPAAAGGVQVGDRVLKFQEICSKSSSNPISLIPDVVKTCYESNQQRSERKSLELVVLRGSAQFLTVFILPQKWEGKGLLGCHLTPL